MFPTLGACNRDEPDFLGNYSFIMSVILVR